MNKILVKSIGRVLRKLLFRVGFRPRISKLKVQSDNIAISAQLNWGLAELGKNGINLGKIDS